MAQLPWLTHSRNAAKMYKGLCIASGQGKRKLLKFKEQWQLSMVRTVWAVRNLSGWKGK